LDECYFSEEEAGMMERESLHIDSQLRQLLRFRGINIPDKALRNRTAEEPNIRKDERTPKRSQYGVWDEVEENINNILQRHKARNDVRLAVQRDKWPTRRLEEVLHQLCTQTHFDLDLCLLLDALDEYDGHPEFISGFLKDLAKGAAFPRTQVKILFSSRPWNVFREEFGFCPGFKIHEHTENDIRNYCIASISGSSQSARCLLPLIEEIVTRSRGVFLWVRLVLRDFFDITAKESQDGDAVERELRRTLDSFPDELDEYYAAIIKRISPASRWDAYVVLECLARSERSLTARELADIVTCSTIVDWPDDFQIRRQYSNRYEAEPFIREVSGGLVDFWPSRVQLMHQTVKDFVEDPRFRFVILSQARAEITEENGHSFLAKFLFLNLVGSVDPTFLFHAREAERTTGLSQYKLFAAAPTNYFHATSNNIGKSGGRFSSPLALAVCAGLQLFLDDAHRADEHSIEACSESLLSSLVYGMDSGLPPEDAFKIAQFLVAKGYVSERDKIGWRRIMFSIWPDRRASGETVEEPVEDYVSLAAHLAKGLKDTEFCIEWTDWADRIVSGKILHMSPPSLAERLLEYGANPNAIDPAGRTPIDYVLANRSVHCSSVGYLYGLSLLLVRNGGRLHKTSREEWEMALQHFENDGYGDPSIEQLQITSQESERITPVSEYKSDRSSGRRRIRIANEPGTAHSVLSSNSFRRRPRTEGGPWHRGNRTSKSGGRSIHFRR